MAWATLSPLLENRPVSALRWGEFDIFIQIPPMLCVEH